MIERLLSPAAQLDTKYDTPLIAALDQSGIFYSMC